MSLDRVENRPHPVEGQISVNVRVAFDDRTAARVESETFFKVVGERDALAIGHDTGRRAGTSTIIFRSDSPVTKREIQEALGELKVLSVRTVKD